MKTYQKYFIILGIMTCLLSSLSFVEAQNDPKAEEKRNFQIILGLIFYLITIKINVFLK